jgi:hypothetical protein
LRLVSDEPGAVGEQPLVSRLRAVIAAKDEQIAVLRAQKPRWRGWMPQRPGRRRRGSRSAGWNCG